MYLTGPETYIQIAFVLGMLGVGGAIDSSIERLKDVSEISSAGLENVLAKAVFIPIVTFFASVAGLIYSVFAVPINMFEALAEAGGLLIDAIFGGAANYLDVSWSVSAQAWFGGVWDQFGPFTILIATGVFLGIFYMLAVYRAEEATGNVIPGFSDIPSWIPLIGQDEDES